MKVAFLQPVVIFELLKAKLDEVKLQLETRLHELQEVETPKYVNTEPLVERIIEPSVREPAPFSPPQVNRAFKFSFL